MIAIRPLGPALSVFGVGALLVSCSAPSAPEPAAPTPETTTADGAPVTLDPPPAAQPPAEISHASGEAVEQPTPSADGAVVASGHYLYWIGGTTGMPRSLVRRFDVERGAWERMPPAGVSRMMMGGAVVGNHIVIPGGMRGVGASTDAVEWYDVTEATWTTGAPLPSALQRVAVAAVDGVAYALGGRRMLGIRDGDLDYESVAEAFAIRADGVTPIAPLPSPRENAAAVTVDGLLYVVGGKVTRSGSDSLSGSSSRRTSVYDPGTDAWTSLARMVRGGAGTAVHVRGKIVFFEEHLQRSPQVYDIATDTWTSQQNRSRDFGNTVEGCGVIDDEIFVITTVLQGMLAPRIPLVVRYHLQSDSWSFVSPEDQAP